MKHPASERFPAWAQIRSQLQDCLTKNYIKALGPQWIDTDHADTDTRFCTSKALE